uniref:Uncharacterized protein n=1 Tax=Zea mays TaxID=4577 RepID=C4J4E7_MAIZE|nr:unknown [Zea mays]|eukprot:NP_001183204.1 uncharacterized protein LOC100501587 [Zea mays]
MEGHVRGRRRVRPGRRVQPQAHRRALLPGRLRERARPAEHQRRVGVPVAARPRRARHAHGVHGRGERGAQRQLLRRPGRRRRPRGRAQGAPRGVQGVLVQGPDGPVQRRRHPGRVRRRAVRRRARGVGVPRVAPAAHAAAVHEHRDRGVPRHAARRRGGFLGRERRAGRFHGAERLALGAHRRRQQHRQEVPDGDHAREQCLHRGRELPCESHEEWSGR